MNAKLLPNLTGLRFFLAVMVVFFHIPQFCRNRGLPFYDSLPIFHRGNEAVYFFFALSGYLIIRQLYCEKINSDAICLKRFYRKRMLRIFPLYYLILTLGLFYYQLILPRLGYVAENDYNLMEGILLSVFFLPNVFNVLYKPGGILEILWSIGIEEQFYLFVAPLFLIVHKKYLLKGLLAFTIGYFILFFSDLIPQLKTFSMFFFYFAAAGFCSILTYKYQDQIRQKKTIAIVFVILMVVYFTSDIFSDSLSETGYHLWSMMLFSFSLAALSLIPFSLFENRVITFLGTISYGIYMFHAFAMHLTGFIFLRFIKIENIPEWISIVLFFVGVIGMTVLMATLSYLYYESFFLKIKNEQNKKGLE